MRFGLSGDLRFVAVLIGLVGATTNALWSPADAACLRNVAEQRPIPARFGTAAVAPGHVGLTFVGHATFLIESADGVRIATDYNDYVRPSVIPDIVTMNNAHTTHFTDFAEPQIRYVLRGWDRTSERAEYAIQYRDVFVRNVPTNVREAGGVRVNGNSIFIFETGGLCIAHLGHLHHRLTQEHLGQLGQIDVLLVPVDGAYTLNVAQMIEVMDQIRAPLVIPMHYFTVDGLDRFLARIQAKGDGIRYATRFSDSPTIMLSRAALPDPPEIRVLPGR